MAEYIDRDTAIRTAIEMCVKVVGDCITQIDAVEIANAFEDIPTADVVPKREVERLQEQVSDLQDELYSETETNKHLGAEYIALRKEKNALNIEIEALKIANEKMYAANKEQEAEIERLTINMNAYGLAAKRLAEEKTEIFAEIEKIINLPFTAGFNLLLPINQALRDYNNDIRQELLFFVAELKKKYKEESK